MNVPVTNNKTMDNRYDRGYPHDYDPRPYGYDGPRGGYNVPRGGYDGPRNDPWGPPPPPHYGGYDPYEKKKGGITAKLSKLGAKLGLTKASEHMGEYGNTFHDFGTEAIDMGGDYYDERPRSKHINDVMERRAKDLNPHGREMSPSRERDIYREVRREVSPSRERDIYRDVRREVSPSRERDMQRGRDVSPYRGREPSRYMDQDPNRYRERETSPYRGREVSPPRERRGSPAGRGVPPPMPPPLPDERERERREYRERDLSPHGRPRDPAVPNGRPHSGEPGAPPDVDEMSLFGNVLYKDVPEDVQKNYEKKLRERYILPPGNPDLQIPLTNNQPPREPPRSFQPPHDDYGQSDRPPSYRASAQDRPVRYPVDDQVGPNLAQYRSY